LKDSRYQKPLRQLEPEPPEPEPGPGCVPGGSAPPLPLAGEEGRELPLRGSGERGEGGFGESEAGVVPAFPPLPAPAGEGPREPELRQQPMEDQVENSLMTSMEPSPKLLTSRLRPTRYCGGLFVLDRVVVGLHAVLFLDEVVVCGGPGCCFACGWAVCMCVCV
jgi:hypothetical protein